jgi:hypothetical protein
MNYAVPPLRMREGHIREEDDETSGRLLQRNDTKLSETLSMSFNHATHPFYPFVKTPQSAENRRSPCSL